MNKIKIKHYSEKCMRGVQRYLWKRDSCTLPINSLKKNIRENVQLTKDEIREIKDFYGTYGFKVGTVYHQWYYTVTGNHDVRFLPDWMLSCYLTERLSDYRMMDAWTDKSYLDKYIIGAKYPKTLVRNVNGLLYDEKYHPIDANAAQKILCGVNRAIVKPSIDSGGGMNIQAFEGNTHYDKIEALYGHNFVIQEFIEQHPSTAALNKTSVNTIRIISLLWKGQVYICGTTLRTGIKGAITDNISHGHGIAIKINQDGILDTVCYSNIGEIFNTAEQFHIEDKHIIASVDGAVDFVKYHHKRLPYFKLIAWDLAVDSAGDIVILEYNVKAIGITLFQYNAGPLFGELTEDVLKEYRLN